MLALLMLFGSSSAWPCNCTEGTYPMRTIRSSLASDSNFNTNHHQELAHWHYTNIDGKSGQFGCIGACNGGAYFEMRKEGEFVKSIEMWHGDNWNTNGVDSIGRICVQLTDGSHGCYGKQYPRDYETNSVSARLRGYTNNYCDKFTFNTEAYEKIWEMTMYSNDDDCFDPDNSIHCRLGYVWFKTQDINLNTREYSCGVKPDDGKEYHGSDVDGYMLAGIFGLAGTDIGLMGVVLAEPDCEVLRREIIDVQCARPGRNMTNCIGEWTEGDTKNMLQLQLTCDNCDTHSPLECKSTFGFTETHSVSTSSASIDSLGGSVEFGFSPNLVVQAFVGSPTVAVKVEYSHTWQQSKTQTVVHAETVNQWCSITPKPGTVEILHAELEVGTMTADVEFTVKTTTKCGESTEKVYTDGKVTVSDVALLSAITACHPVLGTCHLGYGPEGIQE